MAKITYADKVALNTNAEIADINKVTNDDMNEIKSVVNANFDECNNIIESGSNVNGEYIKYSDGTMVCTKKISGNANMSVWFSPIIFADISGGSFASNFISVPNVQITNGESQTLAYNVYNTSTSSVGTIRLVGISTAAMEKGYLVNILAIGKWK